MKFNQVLSLASVAILVACGSTEAQYYGEENGQSSHTEFSNQQGYNTSDYNQNSNGQNQEGQNYQTDNSEQNVSNQGDGQQPSGGVVMHNLIDSKNGSVFAQMPLPSSWKLNQQAQNGTPSITGPGGVEVYNFPYQSFAYSNDQMMHQAYQQSGQQMQQPAGIEAILNNVVGAYAQQQGLTQITKYPLPQVAQSDASYVNALYSAGPKQNRNLAAGSDFKDAKGNKFMIVLHYSENGASDFVSWGYYTQMLKAPAASFEQAKNHYINGLANVRYNQQQINNYNNAEQSKLNQSNSQFQANQRQQQSNFDQQQANYRANQDQISKSSMDTYNSRMESMDRNQHNFTNYIKGESTVTNPNDGNQYQVEAGANQYWMNGNGEYIPSNNTQFDPNQHVDEPYGTWQEAPANPY